MRIWKLAAAAAALTLSLAACGSGGGAAPPPPAGGGTGPTSFAGQTITVWRLGDPAAVNEKYMTDLNAKFKEQTGADVKVEWIAWPDAQAKWTAAITAGSGPDVTEIGNDQVAAWVGQGALADITDMVGSAPELKQIPENLWGYETIENKVYAVPWGGGTRAVLYRKDWFQELNIQVPKTWDELVTAAKTIIAAKGSDVDGFAFNGGADSNMSLSPFVWGAGGDFAVNNGGKWTGKLTEPGFKEGFQFYTDLVAKHGVSRRSALTQNAEEISTRFQNNLVGMYVTGAWDLDGIKERSNGKIGDAQIGFFSIPNKDGNGVAPAFQGGNDIAVWGDSQKKEVAQAYVQLAAGKEFGTRYAKDNGLLPNYPDALAAYASDPVNAAFAQTFSVAKGFPADPQWAEANETKAVLQNAERAVIEGKKTVDQALADANAELETILNSQ
ncbi:extracellular solute-binding protein [Pseudonocardia sp. TRM90224]|uniref:extracellular solute-binding protein n=1 Tax=Pseudonocardia sp. TRM90224 TaxID=2812678 RepID=UPI001E5602E0|nr:extracellular solute-binding protein [Pseudonocardia sp. TRM90224]